MSRRDDIRANALTIPMTAEEKEKIRIAADRMGLTMSAFARLIIKKEIEKEK